jgi:hypothetical protein
VPLSFLFWNNFAEWLVIEEIVVPLRRKDGNRVA